MTAYQKLCKTARDNSQSENMAGSAEQITELVNSVRRIVRAARRAVVVAIGLGRFVGPHGPDARYWFYRNRVEEALKKPDQMPYIVPNGDLFVVCRHPDPAIVTEIRRLLAPEDGAGHAVDELVVPYTIPEDYGPFRRRLEVYERRIATPGGAADAKADGPAGVLRGPLTPALLVRLQDMLDGLDVTACIQRQPVFRRAEGFEPVYTEIYTSLFELRERLFPEVEILPDEPLFFELARHLDRLVLVQLMLDKSFQRQPIGINLGHGATRTEEFQRFDQRLGEAERRNIVIELHWIDYLRDLGEGGELVRRLKGLGYRVAVDRLGLEALTCLNPQRLEADHIKLVFDKRRLRLMADRATLQALRALDMSRVVLTACDDPLAFTLGNQLGITLYQGWLVSREARTGTGGTGTPGAPVGAGATSGS